MNFGACDLKMVRGYSWWNAVIELRTPVRFCSPGHVGEKNVSEFVEVLKKNVERKGTVIP